MKVIIDKNGEAKLAFADLEIRFSGEPFPLYPGEVLKKPIKPIETIPANCAFKLLVKLDYTDSDDVKHFVGDELLIGGPCSYIPRKDVDVLEEIKATLIKPNEALKFKAKRDCVDKKNIKRLNGEEWIVKKCGAYLPGTYEQVEWVIEIVKAHVFTDKKALHVRALKSLTDEFNKKRLNGEEWLVTSSDTETYIPDVYEEIVGVVSITTLNSRQFCVILDPVDPETNKQELGKKKLVKGEKTFFLKSN